MKLLFRTLFNCFKSSLGAYRALPAEKKRMALTKTLMFTAGLLTINYCFGADGNSGINSATTQVKGYFDAGCNLMYAIGAVVGIIGAVRVFNKWNQGEP